MPRPIKLKSRESGEVYTMQWDKTRDPTTREINRFLEEQERNIPAPDAPAGPYAPEGKRSFDELTETFPQSAFNPQPGRNPAEAMPIPQNQNAGVQQEAGMFRKVVDTLYGGKESYLPPVPGVTRPLLPELGPKFKEEFKKSMPGLPGSLFDPRMAVLGYENLVQPSSSLVGAATDWATGKVAGPVARAVAPYVKPLTKPLLGGAVRIGESIFPRAFPKKIPTPALRSVSEAALPEPIRITRALLPEVAETSAKQPRFYAGPEGVADARARNIYDPGPTSRIRPELADPKKPGGGFIAPTILPSEVAPGLVDVPAPVAASYPLGRRAASAPLSDLERAHRRWLPEQYAREGAEATAREAAERAANTGYYSGSRGDVGNLPQTLPPVRAPGLRRPVAASNPVDTSVREVVEKAKATGVPDVVAAAEQAKAVRPLQSTYDKLRFHKDKFVTSISSEIAKDSPAGKVISRIMGRSRQEKKILGEAWNTRVSDATEGLTPGEISEVVEALDKGVSSQAIPSPKVARAAEQLKALKKEADIRAIDSGMGYKDANDQFVPYVPESSAWPQKFDPKTRESKDFVDNIMKATGISREEAERAAKNAGRFGDQLNVKGVNLRDVPGYRRDIESLKNHYFDLADRVVDAEQIGPQGYSKLADHLKNVKNPDLIKRNLDRVYKKDVPVYGESIEGENVRKAITASGWAHLSNFVLGNMNQASVIASKANLSDFAQGLASRFKMGKTAFYKEAKESGAIGESARSIYREFGGKESKMSKFFGIKASEEFNRAVASKTGRIKINRVWDNLVDPKNADLLTKAAKGEKLAANEKWIKKYKSQLEDLLQREVSYDELAANRGKKISRAEENIAGGSMSEKTQGLAEAQDLPYAWTQSPNADAITLYKKYAFRQGRTMVDAIKENPRRFFTNFIPLALTLGEVSGDIRAGVTGGVKGTLTGEGAGTGAKKEIASRGERGQFLLEKMGLPEEYRTPLHGRVVEDLFQAWVFGLAGDAVSSVFQGGNSGLIRMLGGPILDEVFGYVTETAQGAAGTVKELGEGKAPTIDPWKPVARRTVRKLPFVGPGVQRAYFPTERQSTKKKKQVSLF